MHRQNLGSNSPRPWPLCYMRIGYRRSMVRRESCCLVSWIKVYIKCQHKRFANNSDLRVLQDPVYAFSACVVMQMISDIICIICLITILIFRWFYHRSCRIAVQYNRRLFEALTETTEYHTHATFPVIIPHMKHASSRAIAVVATFLLTPLLIVVL